MPANPAAHTALGRGLLQYDLQRPPHHVHHPLPLDMRPEQRSTLLCPLSLQHTYGHMEGTVGGLLAIGRYRYHHPGHHLTVAYCNRVTGSLEVVSGGGVSGSSF